MKDVFMWNSQEAYGEDGGDQHFLPQRHLQSPNRRKGKDQDGKVHDHVEDPARFQQGFVAVAPACRD